MPEQRPRQCPVPRAGGKGYHHCCFLLQACSRAARAGVSRTRMCRECERVTNVRESRTRMGVPSSSSQYPFPHAVSDRKGGGEPSGCRMAAAGRRRGGGGDTMGPPTLPILLQGTD
eukprot:gene24568-biopygen19435